MGVSLSAAVVYSLVCVESRVQDFGEPVVGLLTDLAALVVKTASHRLIVVGCVVEPGEVAGSVWFVLAG